MRPILPFALLVSALVVHGQTSRSEFEAASIKVNAPEGGFHFGADTGSGGPGTADPGMFRCAKCTLATLVEKAFGLRTYQFPGRNSLGSGTFEVMAKIPAGATPDEFQAMLQNLLKQRFGLAYHFTEKKMKGYQLVVAKSGSKLKESSEGPKASVAGAWGHADGAGHSGVMNFNGNARYRADHQTSADIARVLSDQLGAPVTDETGLAGKYDVALVWSGNADHAEIHADAAGHGDHGGAPVSADPAPGLFDAVQAQLGLRLAPAELVRAKIFTIDGIEQTPSGN